MKGYTLNLTAKTLTVTKAFEDAIAKGTGEAYELYTKFLRDIPGLTVERKTHATPTKYTSKSTGETSKCNQFKNLKYENMEKFMMGLPNGEVYMNEYLFLRNYAADIQTNGYTLIRRWFVASSPTSARIHCITSTISPPLYLPPRLQSSMSLRWKQPLNQV